MISEKLIAVAISAYLAAAGDHAALYRGSLEPYFPKVAWTTHPYWQDEDFHTGDISFDGILYTNVPIRYNIYDNVLAVVSPESRIVVAPDPAKIDYFVINGQRYVSKNGWFMRELYGGDNVSLLYSRVKEKTNDVYENGHMRSSMDAIDRIFLVKSDSTLYGVSNLRSVIKACPEYKNDFKQYVKASHLDFGKKNRQDALIKSASFLDTLMTHAATPVQTPLTREAQDTYVAEILTSILPDSTWATIEPVSRVSAYYAYTPGSKVHLEYGDDDEVTETPGITALETLRETRTLEEVEVMGFRNLLETTQGGMEAFRPSLLKNVPLAMGEADVLKLSMMLPGVSSTGEASSGINVRGGATEHNLILYNGNTIFNPMHMFGLFSAFNPDLVAESELYKGSIPSQYGGRLSSVLNIKGRMSDMKDFHGSVSIGLVTAKAQFDLPLVKDKVSLLIGGRSTYSDWMLKMAPSKSGYRDGTAGFWDLGGLLHVNISRTHSLNISGYHSSDRFAFSKFSKYNYTNNNFSAELKSRFGDLCNTTFMVGYDGYDYKNEETEFDFQAARLSFGIQQYFVKGIATYDLTDNHSLNIGAQGQLYKIMPGKYEPMGDRSYIIDRQLDEDQATESAVWIEDNWTLNDQWQLTGGARLNVFASNKEGLSDFYIQPDYRLSAKYSIGDNNAIKAGFNTLHQYIHKVSNTVIMSPTDTWVLSNERIKPQSGWQASLGWYWQTPDLVYELSVEGYYKGMNDYLTYRNGAQLIMNEALEDDVIGAKGRAYGIEVQLRKLTGKLNGWVNYTYSRSQLKQDNLTNLINGGDWFSSDYDCPHEFKLVGNYKMTRRYSTSLNVNYKTGRPYTAPIGTFFNESSGTISPIFSGRNECRMPYYFRVDWSFNVEPSHHLTAKTHRWVTLGVYNLLGRKNAYSIYYKSSGWNIQGYKLSIFGAPIPYITYNIKF